MSGAPEMKNEGSTAGGKQFNRSPVMLGTPKYRFTAIDPQAGTKNINLAGPSSTGIAIFQVPVMALNWTQSVLSYTRTIADQGNGKVSWSHQDTIPEIQKIELYDKNNLRLVDLDDANVYLKSVLPRETKLDTYLANDSANVVYKSNLPGALNPLPVASLGSISDPTNYTSQQHLAASPVGDGAGTAVGAIDQKIDFRLGQLVNTDFALDKDLLYPGIMFVKVTFNATKVGFQGSSNVNPTTGALATGLVSGGTNANNACGLIASPGTCVYLSGLTLLVAGETRPDVIESLQKAIAHKSEDKEKSGYRVMIPFVKLVKNPMPTATQGTNVCPMDGSDGLFLKKAITAVTGAVETGPTAFDTCNLPTAAYAAGAGNQIAGKITQFFTRLDKDRIQDANMYAVLAPPAGQPSDYLEQQRVLKGSAIQGRLQHYQNWAWVDDWTYGNCSDGFVPAETVGGVSLTGAAKTGAAGIRNYYFAYTGSPSAQLNVYTWLVLTRVIQITETGIQWSELLP